MTALRLARLEIEASQEGLPQQVQVEGGAGRGVVPWPQVAGDAVAGQVSDLEADHGASDDGQFPGVPAPARTAGQLLVQVVPGAYLHPPVAGAAGLQLLVGDGQTGGLGPAPGPARRRGW